MTLNHTLYGLSYRYANYQMNNIGILTSHAQNVVVGICSTLSHQIAAHFAFGEQQICRLSARNGAMKIALARWILAVERILEH
jgi:hypothetical protein